MYFSVQSLFLYTSRLFVYFSIVVVGSPFTFNSGVTLRWYVDSFVYLFYMTVIVYDRPYTSL